MKRFSFFYMFLLIFIISNISITFAQNDFNYTTDDEAKDEIIKVLLEKEEKFLIAAIEYGDPKTREAAIIALSDKYMDKKPELATLNAIIRNVGYGVTYGVDNLMVENDNSWVVRRSAAVALGNIGAEEAVPSLIDVLRKEKENIVVVNVIYALGEIGDPSAVPAILDKLRFTTRQNVVYESVVALGKIGDQRAFVEILEIAQDNRYIKEIRKAAVESLKTIEWTEEDNPESEYGYFQTGEEENAIDNAGANNAGANNAGANDADANNNADANNAGN